MSSSENWNIYGAAKTKICCWLLIRFFVPLHYTVRIIHLKPSSKFGVQLEVKKLKHSNSIIQFMLRFNSYSCGKVMNLLLLLNFWISIESFYKFLRFQSFVIIISRENFQIHELIRVCWDVWDSNLKFKINFKVIIVTFAWDEDGILISWRRVVFIITVLCFRFQEMKLRVVQTLSSFKFIIVLKSDRFLNSKIFSQRSERFA